MHYHVHRYLHYHKLILTRILSSTKAQIKNVQEKEIKIKTMFHQSQDLIKESQEQVKMTSEESLSMKIKSVDNSNERNKQTNQTNEVEALFNYQSK